MLHDFPLHDRASPHTFAGPVENMALPANMPQASLSGTGDEAVDYVDPLEDVFGSAPPSPSRDAQEHPAIANQPLGPSDIPRLRSIHVTGGYREGIAASRESHIQVGFDEGYSLGAEIGLQAGWCLGSLQGLCDALAVAAVPDKRRPLTATDATCLHREAHARVCKALRCAREELSLRALLDAEYFGSDGLWLYDLPNCEDDEPTTKPTMFSDVAAAHPVLSKWSGFVVTTSRELGLKANAVE